VSDRLAAVFGGVVAVCRHDSERSDVLAFSNDPEEAMAYQAYYARFDGLLSHLQAEPALTVVTECDKPDMPGVFRYDYLGRLGRPHMMYARATTRGSGDLVLGVSRSCRPGVFERYERRTALFLARHLARAATISAQAGPLLANLRALEQALEHQGLAVLVVDASGRVRSRNQQADRLVRRGHLRIVHERLCWGDVVTEDSVRRAIACASRPTGRIASSLRTRAVSGPALEIDVVPLDDGAADAMLVVRAPRPQAQAERVAAAYGLTPAEARLLAALSEGERVADYADRAGIALSTAKTHLRALFEKTGVNRQADLMRLVAGSAQ
jgi:DNA-binding CsgD family transcriptional regulator